MNEENALTTVPQEMPVEIAIADIQSRIFTIRGMQVMLDRDLAPLYGVETKYLNKQVKRNIERFPEDFMFQLTKEESSRFQNGTLDMTEDSEASWFPKGTMKRGRGSNLKYRPYVFTEHGVSQLSGVLKSQKAVDASIIIIRAFVAMRRFLSANANLFQRVEALEVRQIESDKKIEQVLDKLDELSPVPTTEQMFATGCVWDAYTYVSGLVRSALRRIVLIDNFVDERTLLILDKRQKGVDCEVHTRYTEQVLLDFKKHNEQCSEIGYVQLPLHIHDRYLVIDDTVWLLGASVKDMGHGLCSVVKMGLQPDVLMSVLK